MTNQSELATICYVLLLRLKITGRFIKELGWIRFVLVGVTLMMFFAPVFSTLDSIEGEIYLSVLYLALAGGIHFNRNDHFFLQSLGITKYKLFAAEYGLVAIPFLILSAYLGVWIGVVILILAWLIIAHVPVPAKALFNSKRALQFPFYLPIEWISGLRRQIWVVAILLVLGMIVGWWKLFTGWMFLFLITTTVVTFYGYCEPRQFILLSHRTPASFVGNKMLKGALYYILATGVLWVELLIMYPESAFYSLLFLGVNSGLLLLVIAGKYAFYREHSNIDVMTGVIFGIGCICLLVPYLSPVFFFLQIWLIWRGTQRLKEEVYAFH